MMMGKRMMRSGFLPMLFALLFFLVVQFLLGMYINLYVTIPAMYGFSMMGFEPLYSGFPIVMAHMFLGILIGLTSIGILILSVGTGSRRIMLGSAGLFLSVLLAGIDGLFFLFDGQNNLNSYLMSTGFILAMLFSILLLIYAGPGNANDGMGMHH
ncbi:MAG: hypothetical protein ACP5NK_02915 [Thermoplasmata archaeon]